jgi:ribulose-phosphate 3-epimerase
MSHIISPSILSCDFAKLPSEIKMLDESVAEWIHVDVMDGQFVPNFTFGMTMVEAVNRLTDKTLDVHLMMVEPEKYIERFRKAGADMITVHHETCPHLHRTLQQIRETGAKAGVALNPHTPVSNIFDILEEIDLVLIMSVNPGFGGQKFIPQTINRVRELRNLLDISYPEVIIQIDGGVDLDNARQLIEAGADNLVAGTSVFKALNREDTVNKFYEIAKNVNNGQY